MIFNNFMKKILILVVFLLPLWLHSQVNELNKITEAGSGIYFMYFDSSKSKSTIVEFNDFVALIEAPVIDLGANAKELKEDYAAGEKILRTLKNKFPAKPLKYFLFSHWHPHSVSVINPFLKEGVMVVTTESNFNTIKVFIDTSGITGYNNNFIFVNDSLIIDEPGSIIIVYRFTKKDYPNVPTEDYLYFYMPAQKLMHCACMYSKWEGKPVYGKEMITGREEDLFRFISLKGINPEYLIRLSNEKEMPNDMQPVSGLQNVILNGIKSSEIIERFISINETELNNMPEKYIIDIIDNNIPPSLINTAVYTLLRDNKLSKALAIARLQTLLNPSDANSWDTYGEVYYFLGNEQMALFYEKQSKKVDPGFSGGGLEVWKNDLESYKKIWKLEK